MQNQVIKLHCQSSQILSSIVFSLITFFRSWQTAMILIFSSHTGHKSCGLWKRHCQQQFPCLDCRFSCSLNLAAPGERTEHSQSLYTASSGRSKARRKRHRQILGETFPAWKTLQDRKLWLQQPKPETERFQDFLQKTGTCGRGKELEMNLFLITGAKIDKWH